MSNENLDLSNDAVNQRLRGVRESNVKETENKINTERDKRKLEAEAGNPHPHKLRD